MSAATLARAVYDDLRSRAQGQEPKPELEPQAEFIARQVRVTLREQDTVLPPGTERITEVVAAEIVRQSARPRE